MLIETESHPIGSAKLAISISHRKGIPLACVRMCGEFVTKGDPIPITKQDCTELPWLITFLTQTEWMADMDR